MRHRTAIFTLWCSAIVGCFSLAFADAMRESVNAGYTSHILVMPFIAAFLFWSSRKAIFEKPECSWKHAAYLLVGAFVLVLIANVFRSQLAPELFSFASLSAALILVISGFVACYGTNALKNARFPFLILFLGIPIPSGVMNSMISVLQSGSTGLTHLAFVALGVPVIREGFVLSVPGATIEVARECSGINSTIALLITTLLLAHESLQSNWHRLVLLFIALPMSIMKNAIRIVTLTMLAIRVDPSFLTGRLHHQGGFVFFLLTLAIMYPVWKKLYNAEKKDRERLCTEADGRDVETLAGSMRQSAAFRR
jgi:exosortase